MLTVRGEMQHIARLRNSFVAFDKEPGAAGDDNRHLFMWVRVHGCHKERCEAKPANHYLIAHDHLSLDA